MSELTKHEPTTIYIKPSTGLTALNLRDLWVYRELVFFMIWRDIKVRYKQTMLGAAWAVIQPVMTMLVFTFIFGSVAKVPTDGIPYPIFSYTALLPWGLFVAALNQASRSLTSNNNMITKVYFPRLVLPIASVLAGLVDFAIAFVILIGLMFYYKVSPAWNVLWALPLFAYSASVISEKWQLVYSLNPMAGVVNGFRWALLGAGNGPDMALWVSASISLVILVTGLFYFRNMERTFADTI
jgi:lipopolysaccharide transport system permease protein